MNRSTRTIATLAGSLALALGPAAGIAAAKHGADDAPGHVRHAHGRDDAKAKAAHHRENERRHGNDDGPNHR